MAVDIDLVLVRTDPDSLAARLTGTILLSEGELAAGGQTIEDVRGAIADVLLADALTRAS